MDLEAKKKALRMVPYGLYIVGAGAGEETVGFTGSFCTQSSFDPPLVAIGVKVGSTGYEVIAATRAFSLNVLSRDEQGIAIAKGFFQSQRAAEGMLGGYPFTPGETGAPILEDVPAFLECRVVEIVEKGDHHLVLGEVVAAGHRRDARALTMEFTGWSYAG